MVRFARTVLQRSAGPWGRHTRSSAQFAVPSTHPLAHTLALVRPWRVRALPLLLPAQVSYFYDGSLGDFYYGPTHPMKPHRVRMAHDLIIRTDLYQHMQVRTCWTVGVSLHVAACLRPSCVGSRCRDATRACMQTALACRQRLLAAAALLVPTLAAAAAALCACCV